MKSTTGIHPRTETAKKLHLSFPNRIFWNFSHKPHFHNAISHSVRSVKIRSILTVWIFFLSTNRNFFQRNQLQASTLGPKLQENSIYLFQIESSGTFLTSPHFHNAISHRVRSVKIRSVPTVWIFFLSTNRNFFQRNQIGASTLGREPQKNSIYLFQIESSGTFIQTTFPQCYMT